MACGGRRGSDRRAGLETSGTAGWKAGVTEGSRALLMLLKFNWLRLYHDAFYLRGCEKCRLAAHEGVSTDGGHKTRIGEFIFRSVE